MWMEKEQCWDLITVNLVVEDYQLATRPSLFQWIYSEY